MAIIGSGPAGLAAGARAATRGITHVVLERSAHLADTIVLLRYFEAEGRVRKAISVLKKRSGQHEDTIRELHLEPGGIRLGPPLSDMRGVLTGVPQVVGPATIEVPSGG